MPTINSPGSRSAGAQEWKGVWASTGAQRRGEAWGRSGRWPQQELESVHCGARRGRLGRGAGWPEGERVVLRGDRGRPGPPSTPLPLSSPSSPSYYYPAVFVNLLILLIILCQAHPMLLVLWLLKPPSDSTDLLGQWAAVSPEISGHLIGRRHPSVPYIVQLAFFIDLWRYIKIIPLNWWVNLLKSSTSTGYSSNSTESSLTSGPFSPFIDEQGEPATALIHPN